MSRYNSFNSVARYLSCKSYAQALFDLILSIESSGNNNQHHDNSTNFFYQTTDVIQLIKTIYKLFVDLDIYNNPSIDLFQLIEKVFDKIVISQEIKTYLFAWVGILIKNKKLSLIGNILTNFEQLVREHEQIKSVIIETAYTLTNEEKIKIEATLAKKFNIKISSRIIVNRELIGGLKIYIGDNIIDRSLLSIVNSIL